MHRNCTKHPLFKLFKLPSVFLSLHRYFQSCPQLSLIVRSCTCIFRKKYLRAVVKLSHEPGKRQLL